MGSDEGMLYHASGKLCILPFQLESGGNMVHLKDLSTQAMRFGLLFRQVLKTQPSQG